MGIVPSESGVLHTGSGTSQHLYRISGTKKVFSFRYLAVHHAAYLYGGSMESVYLPFCDKWEDMCM